MTEDGTPYRWADRWRMAAEGNLEELQMLRDDVLQLCAAANIPWDETLAQAEIVARMAAARGEPSDVLSLASILLLRATHLRQLSDIELCSAHDYLKLEMTEAFEARMEAGKLLTARSEKYEAEAKALFPKVAHGDDPGAAAILVSALTTRADNGDDEALTLLQTLIDGMGLANLGAVKAALRTLEQELEA